MSKRSSHDGEEAVYNNDRCYSMHCDSKTQRCGKPSDTNDWLHTVSLQVTNNKKPYGRDLHFRRKNIHLVRSGQNYNAAFAMIE